MLELTDKELEILNKEIEQGGLTYTELQQELLDHLCCDIEVKMEEGLEFLKALEEVKKEMGQDCFRQIQEDTLLLINLKYRMMKKFMYILGSIAPSMVIIGTIFKVQHWPGASVMLVLGLSLLALVYLPIYISVKIRDTRNDSKPVKKGIYIIGMISGIIFILGAMFKIMHWPGAGSMTILAGLVSIAVFIPLLLANALRDKENQVQNFTVLIFVVSFIAIIYMTFALSVSKDVMNSFSLAVADNNSTHIVLQENNAVLAESILEINPSLKESVTGLTEKINGLNSYINETIETLVLEAHDNNDKAIDGKGNIDYDEVLQKHNANIPAYMMLGIDYDVARGEVIKGMMEDIKAYISSLENEELIVMTDKLLNTAPHEGKYTASWVSHNFEHLPMISVIVQLTNIQVNAQIVEGEALRMLKDHKPELL